MWLLTVSDSWNKGLEDTQVAWKTDLSQESLQGLSVLKQDSMVGPGVGDKAFRPPAPSLCADPTMGLGVFPEVQGEKHFKTKRSPVAPQHLRERTLPCPVLDYG